MANIVRVIISIALVYMVYLETGFFTATAIFLTMLNAEVTAVVLKRQQRL